MFGKTFGRLAADRAGLTVSVIGFGLIVLVAWCWWAVAAEFTLYEVSTAARVELDTSTSPIQSPVRGRVVRTNLKVGHKVHQGDVLVEIDAVPDRLQLQQEQIRARGLEPELARLRSQVAAEERARLEERRTANLGAEEAANRIRQAETAARHSEAEFQRIEKLHAARLVSERDLAAARTEAQALRAAVVTLESAARRIPQEQTTRDRERDVRIERLRSEIATLESERRTISAGIARLEYEIGRHLVRSPVDGTVAESALLRVGAVVQESDRLASIVPSGQLLVAAQFPAHRAFGRIRERQAATLRLDAFPWAEFGAVRVHVFRVAREIRDGNVRVELTIEPQPTFRGSLEHGMPGSVEVAVERLSPLWLILRTVGQAVTAR